MYEQWKGKIVCVDTQGSMIFTGVLEDLDDAGLLLSQVDVHDLTTSTTTRDLYFLTLKGNVNDGSFQPGREQCFILRERVVALTPLDQIISY